MSSGSLWLPHAVALAPHARARSSQADPPILATQDLDLEDAPLAALTLLPWTSVASLLASEKKVKDKTVKSKEKVLFERQGFGEEGGEGDAY